MFTYPGVSFFPMDFRLISWPTCSMFIRLKWPKKPLSNIISPYPVLFMSCIFLYHGVHQVHGHGSALKKPVAVSAYSNSHDVPQFRFSQLSRRASSNHHALIFHVQTIQFDKESMSWTFQSALWQLWEQWHLVLHLAQHFKGVVSVPCFLQTTQDMSAMMDGDSCIPLIGILMKVW